MYNFKKFSGSGDSPPPGVTLQIFSEMKASCIDGTISRTILFSDKKKTSTVSMQRYGGLPIFDVLVMIWFMNFSEIAFVCLNPAYGRQYKDTPIMDNNHG